MLLLLMRHTVSGWVTSMKYNTSVFSDNGDFRPQSSSFCYDLLCIITMMWRSKFKKFRFTCAFNKLGRFSQVKSIKFCISLNSSSRKLKALCTHVQLALNSISKTYIERWISTLLYGCQTLIMNVGLQEFLELSQSICDPGNKVVHPTEICSYEQYTSMWVLFCFKSVQCLFFYHDSNNAVNV